MIFYCYAPVAMENECGDAAIFNCVSIRMGSSLHVEQALTFPSATGALIMEITCGMNIESREDKLLQTGKYVLE